MENRSRAMKAVLCALMIVCVLSFVVSSFIPGVCVDHDCSGERCFVCLCASIGKNLSSIILAAAGLCFILAHAALSVRFDTEGNDYSIKEQTPVYLKVKLSN